jgi:2-polyprenyl-3-methyl-5-hydroxy-6-metoxy-1,4-benzoquinol methylase
MMQRTGERQLPDVPGSLVGLDIKHTQRYQWASTYTRGKKVYDVACGAGYGNLILMASSYTGFDISSEAIEYAKTYYTVGPTDRFYVEDANDMPIMDMADVIVSFETVEHIKEPEKFMKWCSLFGKTTLISSPIKRSYRMSHYHLFEYKLSEFKGAISKYFSKVDYFIQKDGVGIIYPCLDDDKGVAIALCQP